MKKIIVYNLFAIIFILITSCESENTSIDSPVLITLTANNNHVTISENLISNNFITYSITATIDEPQEVDIITNLTHTSGNALRGVDFDFEDTVTISSGDTSVSTLITIYATGDIEPIDETFTVTASIDTESYSLSNPFSFTGTITDDYINDVLNLSFAWPQEIEISTDFFDIVIFSCDIDLDFYIYDANFIDIGNTDANLDVCEENMTLSNLSNGSYYIISHVYDNPYTGLGETNPIPITITYSQDLVIEETFFINNNVNLETTNNSIIVIAKLEVVNGAIYTIEPQ